MEKYFVKFPTINYSNTACRDISKRVSLTNKVRATPTLFYPYEVTEGLREDLLASSYYEDSYYDWLIYLSNGIIDPYYGWYLNTQDFENFIKKKYGSIENSIKRIKYYHLNWSEDRINITPDYYDTNLPEVLKKYYTPNFGDRAKILSYKRREELWIVNTNKIYQFNVNLHSNAVFSNNELVEIRNSNNSAIGAGEVITQNSSSIIIKNISGNTNANNIVFGESSSANATILDTDLLQSNISDDEFVYWQAVSFYDYENDKNENNKFINLLDANWALPTAEELRKKLK